jgi:cellulose 1,4-beta-cellobiosidase
MTSVTLRAAQRPRPRRGIILAAIALLFSVVMVWTPPPAGSTPEVENPYAGATGYINPAYADAVQASADQEGGTLGSQIGQLASVPTAVWLDRIAAVVGGSGVTMTLRDHLDAALAQQSGGTPVVITLIVYDLPNRDCAALASNGELLVSENGEERYRTEYIDPLAEILGDPQYDSLRKVAVVEPDSLPNLITNLNEPRCAEANSSGAYVEGIQYALDQLYPIPNTYLYLDIAHSGWLGWDSNFGPAVNLISSTIAGSAAGVESVEGFVSNTANYTPTEEPFLPDPNLNVGGQPVMSGTFYEFNPYFDELDYVQAMRSAFVSSGFPSDIGMLIDTSRNGWGGADRPTGVSTSTDLNTYVDESRIDRRPHRGGWCNQSGAGIGIRPTAAPATGVDAYVWIKPPGESDGVSEEGIPDPDDPNKQFDAMCDPNAQNRYNPAYPTNALPGAPHAGRWFHDQLVMLVQNAFPTL